MRPPWRTGHRVAAVLLLALHAVLAWRLRVPGLTTGHDDAWYLSLARALRHGSYADLPIVGTPTHAMYPPLYPTLLAMLGVDRPEDIVVGVAVNVALSVLALALAALLAARRSSWSAIALLVVCAPNPLLLERAASISSEPLFMVTTLLALWLLSGADGGDLEASVRSSAPGSLQSPVQRRLRPRTRTIVYGAMAVLAATLTRSIGLALLLATLAHWLLARRWHRAGALALAGALTTGVWLAWTVRAPKLDAGRSYIADAMYTGVTSTAAPATASNAGPPRVASPSLASVVVERVRRNVPSYLTRELPSALAVPTLRDTPLDNVFWSVLLLGGGLTGLLLLMRPLRLVVLFIMIYLGVLAVWPYVLERFLAPVLPLLVLLVVAGLVALIERAVHALRIGRIRADGDATPGASDRVVGMRDVGMRDVGMRGISVGIVGLVATTIAFSGLRRDATALRALSGCNRNAPVTSSGCFSDEQRDFFAAAALVNRTAPDTARLLSSKEATLYQLTGRQSVREAHALAITRPEQFAQFLAGERVGYILLSRLHLDQWSLAALLTARCRDYALVQTFGAHVALLRVRTPADIRSSNEADGCAAIDRWSRGDWES